MKISLLTVTYNSSDFLLDYFESIVITSEFQQSLIEVLVYDAGSSDETQSMLHNYHVTYKNISIFIGDNIGFAGGNNYLALKAQSDYLFFLNPDTKIKPNTISGLLSNMNSTTLIVPKQFYFNNQEIGTGNLGMDIYGYPYGGNNSNLFYADGAAILINKTVFFKIGMFDENYFMFYEDIDLSWRALLYGYNIEYSPEISLYHFSGGSIVGGGHKNKIYTTTTTRRYLNERNSLQNIIKNYSLFTLIIILPVHVTLNILEILLFTLMGKFKVVKSYLRAYLWVFVNLKLIMKKRNIVQTSRVISDLKILKLLNFKLSKIKIFIDIGIPKFK